MMRVTDITLQLATAFTIALLYTSGQIGLLLHPRFQIFTLVAAIVLALYTLRSAWSPERASSLGARMAYIALLAALALFAWHSPSRHSMAKALEEQTTPSNAASRDTQEIAIPRDPDASAELYTNIPWIMAQARQGKWNFSQTVWVRGAVTRHAALDRQGMLLLTRPFMVCCAADIQTFALLMPVAHPERYTDGQWLTVQGRVEKVQDTLKRRAPWERRAQTLYARDLHLHADSIILVDIDVPDPYVYYQLDGSFADF